MRLLAFPLLLLALARPGWAQARCLEQIKFPPVGRWAEYQATFKHDPYLIRLCGDWE